MLTKTDAKQLQSDYIPGGTPVDVRKLKFRRTQEWEVLQCCAQTSVDPQSGPIYCGAVAEFVSEEVNGGAVAFCGRRGHKPPPGTLEE